jgi:microcystin-dependent protein
MEGFIGEIRMFAGDFAPKGWHFCDGSTIPIEKSQALYLIIKTYYGGDGTSTFALPDLRGRVPVGAGQGPVLANIGIGEWGGKEDNVLDFFEMPVHAHSALTTGNATINVSATSGTNSLPAEGNSIAAMVTGSGRTATTVNAFNNSTPNTPLNLLSVGVGANMTVNKAGGNQAHSNMQPSIALRYIICVSRDERLIIEGTLSEIRLFGGSNVPVNWAKCEGQLLSINENQALFSLLGTTYGGDGQTTFALPDLRARTALASGRSRPDKNYTLGEMGGTVKVGLTSHNLPQHNHPTTVDTNPRLIVSVSSANGNVSTPAEGSTIAAANVGGRVPAPASGFNAATPNTPLNAGSLSFHPTDYQLAGGINTHNNMQPYLGLNYIICVDGSYPLKESPMKGTLGEIRFFAGSNIPKNWALCRGQKLKVVGKTTNRELFSILGKNFGGNGDTFMLPNTQGRVTIGTDEGRYTIGQTLGTENVTLTIDQIPEHTHQAPPIGITLNVSNHAGTLSTPTHGASISAAGSGVLSFNSNTPDIALNDATAAVSDIEVTCGTTGSTKPQPHSNMMPYTVLNQIICISGDFPIRP